MSTAAPAASPAAELRRRLDERTAVIGIVGLGYVGLPLARAVHRAGYPVLGYDVDPAKITALEEGTTYLEHLGEDLSRELAASDRFAVTCDDSRLAEADVILLCVPTPLGKHNEPDLSFVLDSTRMCAKVLRRGQLIVLESTTYPGTTRDEMGPILEAGGLRCGEDFFLAYSPEREDPGRQGTTTETIPKLVGGCDAISGELANQFYTSCIAQVHFVESAEIAEAAKLLENIYRAVNIAMVNELKMLLTDMDIDVWQVIEAASTKPFGFQPFFPGPGLGGHCIPIDPFYLTWKAKEIGRTTRFIELAGEVNRGMPRYVVDRVTSALNDDGHSLKDAEILIIGVAYKPDIDDMRESPAAEIIDLLDEAGANVAYHDPHVPVFPRMRKHDIDLQSVDLSDERLAAADCVLVVTDHQAVDYARIGAKARLVVDSRNAMIGVTDPAARVLKA
ncbi:MAG: nucleotide sugar dehydrogenase [Phycisphaerales bacterium]